MITFLSLSQLFVNTCLRLTYFVCYHSEAISISNFIIYWFDFIIICAVNLFMVLTLCILSNEFTQTDELLRSIESLLYHNYNSRQSLKSLDLLIFFKKLLILNQIKNHYKYDNKLNAWGMFVIKKKFLISFLGAVIPFSVMLIQMQQNYNGKS